MMEIKFEGKGEKYKVTVMAILLAASCFLTYYFHLVLRTGVIFTHFFYIPIILACLWWKGKGLVVAIFLAGLLIFSHIFLREEVTTADDYLRAFMFVVIASVVATLSGQIAKTDETLIRSEKLKALGEMAAGVAHDFNNLLAIILGNAQLLEKGLKRYKSEEIKKRLKIIARTAEEGGETVRRLQHFTHREVLIHDFTKIDLNEIVRDAIASTSPRWKDEAEAKGITIKIKEKLEKLPLLLGSRSELMEVLTNLIFNALEAMPEGGEIIIKTEAKENKIYLYFTDSGKGIPDRIKEKIFDPFFTTKGPKASGLGLSVSYSIIKRHKGKIKVESIKGKGTTFTISIPIGLGAPSEKEKLAGSLL